MRCGGTVGKIAAKRLASFCGLVKSKGGPSLEPQTAPNLSARQHEVLALIARGRTDREIAFNLGISPRTVRMHIDALRLKLRVQRRRDLFVTYHDLGGVDLLGE